MAEQVYPRDGDETLTRDEEKMYSREFLSQVREYIRKGRPEASLIAFNSRLKLTFPRQGEEEWEGEEISGACREMIAGGMFEEIKGRMSRLLWESGSTCSGSMRQRAPVI